MLVKSQETPRRTCASFCGRYLCELFLCGVKGRPCGAPGVRLLHVVLVISWLPLPVATRCCVIDEGLFILLLLMDRKRPPTTSDLTDPYGMLGNEPSTCRTHWLGNEVLESALRFHLPLSLCPAAFFPLPSAPEDCG